MCLTLVVLLIKLKTMSYAERIEKQLIESPPGNQKILSEIPMPCSLKNQAFLEAESNAVQKSTKLNIYIYRSDNVRLFDNGSKCEYVINGLVP